MVLVLLTLPGTKILSEDFCVLTQEGKIKCSTFFSEVLLGKPSYAWNYFNFQFFKLLQVSVYLNQLIHLYLVKKLCYAAAFSVITTNL